MLTHNAIGYDAMNEREHPTSLVRIRPRVAELQFRLFGRCLHPELYESCESRRFERGKYCAQIDILRTGHLLRWTYDERVTLCEVVTTSSSPMPCALELLSARFQGSKSYRHDGRRGVRYRSHAQVEKVDPELLYMYQNELCHEGRKGMLQLFGSSGRVLLGGLSYVYAETRSRSLLVQSLHTFPDDGCLIKIESLFQVPQ